MTDFVSVGYLKPWMEHSTLPIRQLPTTRTFIISAFFSLQVELAEWTRPHQFGQATIRRLINNINLHLKLCEIFEFKRVSVFNLLFPTIISDRSIVSRCTLRYTASSCTTDFAICQTTRSIFNISMELSHKVSRWAVTCDDIFSIIRSFCILLRDIIGSAFPVTWWKLWTIDFGS